MFSRLLLVMSILLTTVVLATSTQAESWSAEAFDSSSEPLVREVAQTTSVLSGTLFINEFMAKNDTILEDPDEKKEHPDWFELYNAGSEAVDLMGLYLTDDLANPTQHKITQTLTIPAGGFMLFYADQDLGQGATHVDFKLSTSGESLAIYDTDGSTLIDSYTFGEQTADVSEGRSPDGADNWMFFTNGTPGRTNLQQAPVISDTSHMPAEPSASDEVTVSAMISDDGTLITTTLYYRVDAGSFMSVSLSGAPSLSRGSQANNLYTAQIPAQADGALVEYYLFAEDNDRLSSTAPSSAPNETFRYIVNYQPPTLLINEFMAKNDTILEDPDEADDFPDWFELYNPGDEAVDLMGLYLTDDLTNPTQHKITQTLTIPAGGFMLFYADEDLGQGPTHVDFKLKTSGESLAIYGADGTTLINHYTFGQQSADVSEGRCPDGSNRWARFSSPTPGASNGVCHITYLPLVVKE
ncbi:MAG: lamin tail domain-containing protein [Ardenticatenaceae bacterium]